jgi:hypothetical protein
MVQLDIPMPKQCLHDNCPCLATFVFKNDDVMIRTCAAKSQRIIVYYPLTNNPPNDWMDFKKPDWCPLIEVKSKLYDSYEEEEERWHMSMAGLGGSYEYE